ncbi:MULTISPECIES: hypothetical protein [unclassified Actinopolyspora]|uniref:hypothetical protein n=1 Tax=unclassified Actinopolyspora TaxID=2639451 RepID=UPI0013F5BD2B|nr:MULTISPECIES: hypothetical protein [unclassified Actinopolyspora]NHD16014.1 hypothetical protein [Actinopolyspora sp. BKK2]NHE74772.1 hypothetical protein [Actinopolyspora sp. BKK1]
MAALTLLDDSEHRWRQSLSAAVQHDNTAEAPQHRRELARSALHAYDRLRAEHAPTADPLTVFLRWPACTLVTLVWLASSVREADELRAELVHSVPETLTPTEVDTWLRGWAAAWHALTERERAELTAPANSGSLPALQLLWSATGIATQPRAEFGIRLDIPNSAVVLSTGEPHRRWTVRAAGVPCPEDSGRWVVPLPATTVECRDQLGTSRSVSVVDPDEPLLVFDAHGELVPAEQPVPPGEVWLLHRGIPGPAAFDGQRRVLEETTPPNGWPGWWLGRVLLTETHALRAAPETSEDAETSDGAEKFGPWRHVDHPPRAEFSFEPPVAALRTPHGEPVRNTAPRIELTGNPATRWTIAVAREGHASAERLTTHRVTTADSPLDLGDLLPRPAFGRFRVTATSPRNTTPRTFTLVQDLAVRANLQVRMLHEQGGLHSAHITIRPPSHVRASPETVHLNPHTRSERVHLSTSGQQAPPMTVEVEPEHLALRKRTTSQTHDWEVVPQHYELDELDDGASLELALPPVIRQTHGGPPELLAHDGATTWQRLSGRSASSRTVRYNLAELTDTVRAHGSLRLQLALPGQDAQVATVLLPPPASEVLRHRTHLQLVRRLPREHLRVRIRSVHAPWLPVQTGELPERTTHLPLNPAFHGDELLLVEVHYRRADPAEQDPAQPALPEASAVFRTGDESLTPALTDPVERAAVDYLADRGPLPHTSTALPLLWTITAHAEQLFGTAVGRATAQETATRLGASPTTSLLATATAQPSTRELVPALVRSGIAAHSFRHVTDPDQVRELWPEVPLAALLLTSPLLAYRTGSPHWDPAELDTDEAALLAALDSWGGPRARELLTGARLDPDEHSPPLHGHHAPADSCPRRDPHDDPDTLAELRTCHTVLSDSPTPQQHPALFATAIRCRPTARNDELGPEKLSLDIALIARLAAQGDRAAAATERHLRHGWTRLAELAPEHVATDLALAEFLVVGRHAHPG